MAGAGTIVQLLPSQCSKSACCTPPAMYIPTAHASLAEIAAASCSLLNGPLFALGTTVQLTPSQCSMSVW